MTVKLNSNDEETVWWHTVLHGLAFPVIFIGLIMLIGLMMYFLGHLNSWTSIISRAIQYGLAAHFSLVLPTFFLTKSNELVVSVIVGTLYAAFSIVVIFASEYLVPNGGHSFGEWVELLATFAGAMIGIGIYYFGER